MPAYDIFRNQINWNDCDVKDTPVNCTPTKTERNVPSSQYRCGFCHQISNWKHVIEVIIQVPMVVC